MKKLAFLLVLVIALLTTSCQFITGEALEPTPTTTPTPEPVPTPLPAPEPELPFKINISPSEASYLPGEEILNYFDYRITNGFVEGKNNRIKTIKRMAYGYRNMDNFRMRILAANLRCEVRVSHLLMQNQSIRGIDKRDRILYHKIADRSVSLWPIISLEV